MVNSSSPRANSVSQAGGLQGREAGFHGKFVSEYLQSLWVCESRRQRIAAIFDCGCIDPTRMNQPVFCALNYVRPSEYHHCR